MPGQVMPLPKRLVADGALELLLSLALHGVELPLVVRAHVVHQVAGHAEGGVALGAPVLRHVDGGHGRGHERGAGALQDLLHHGVVGLEEGHGAQPHRVPAALSAPAQKHARLAGEVRAGPVAVAVTDIGEAFREGPDGGDGGPAHLQQSRGDLIGGGEGGVVGADVVHGAGAGSPGQVERRGDHR